MGYAAGMNENINLNKLLEQLKNLLGDRLSLSESVRQHHGEEMTHYDVCLPDAVAFPESTEEVSRIVKLCNIHEIPVIPYGAGTSFPNGGRF